MKKEHLKAKIMNGYVSWYIHSVEYQFELHVWLVPLSKYQTIVK